MTEEEKEKWAEIEFLIQDYCYFDCDMRDYCALHDCPITHENYKEYMLLE